MAYRIMVADDSHTVQKSIELSLSDIGPDIEITNVDNGADAIELLPEIRPDLVVIDVLLPKKNGYEVSREIKESVAFKKTAVLLLCSNFARFDPKKVDESLCDDTLEKPFEPEQFLKIVKKHYKQPESEAPAGVADTPQKIWSIDPFSDTPKKATEAALAINTEPAPAPSEPRVISIDDPDSLPPTMPRPEQKPPASSPQSFIHPGSGNSGNLKSKNASKAEESAEDLWSEPIWKKSPTRSTEKEEKAVSKPQIPAANEPKPSIPLQKKKISQSDMGSVAAGSYTPHVIEDSGEDIPFEVRRDVPLGKPLEPETLSEQRIAFKQKNGNDEEDWKLEPLAPVRKGPINDSPGRSSESIISSHQEHIQVSKIIEEAGTISEKVIEKVARELVPGIAEKIIRQELHKLLEKNTTD